MNNILALTALCLSVWTSMSSADTALSAVTPDPAAVAAAAANLPAENATATTVKSTVPDWMGDFGLGAGIGVNYLTGDHDINNARVTEGKIEVGDSHSVKTQIWLEAHYLFGGDYVNYVCTNGPCSVQPYNVPSDQPEIRQTGGTWAQFKKVSFGPFFAIQVGEDGSIINGAAFGPMMSFKKTTIDSDKKITVRAFNLGLGITTEKIQGLANGLKEGDTVTAGTQVTYKNYSRTGIALIFSVSIF